MKTADLFPLKDAQYVQHMCTHTLTVKLILADLWTLQCSFILSLSSWVRVINQLTASSSPQSLSSPNIQFSSVTQSCLTLCEPMNCSMPGLPVHHQPGAQANLRPSSRWCHPAILTSVAPFSSYPQALPASGSFPMSQLFAWGGQNIGVSASTSVLPMNTQDWSPLGWTGWISLQSKGLSRVTVQKHPFFSAQPSSQFNSHILTWPQEKP